MTVHRHPDQPLLDTCPPTLPRAAYLDRDWYAREQATLWRRQWVAVGRVSDFAPGTMTRVRVGDAPAIVCRAADGALSAFHNTCRHRGAELCRNESQPLGRLITCPYHAWSYDAQDGRLVSVAHAHPTDDFRREDHGLFHLNSMTWNGFLFLCANPDPAPLRADVPLATLDRWPMDGLETGHRWIKELDCNWKVFWENYSECLHCPGIHPELCDLVPIYRQGVMAPNETQGWTPGAPQGPMLKAGAESWTMTGAPCGPAFAGLTERERQQGYTFVTLWPSIYVVAHLDHVRAVRIEPLGPERTRLTAEWYFPPETRAQTGFDAEKVAAFAKIVLGQDGEVAEINQRGIRSPAYAAGRLMPEEYEIHRFHRWVLSELEATP